MSRRIRFMSLLGVGVALLFVLSVMLMSGVIGIYRDLIDNKEGNKLIVLEKQINELLSNDFWVKGNITINANQRVNIEGNITSTEAKENQLIQPKERRFFELELIPVNRGVVLEGVGINIRGYIENGQIILEDDFQLNWLDLFDDFDLSLQENRNIEEVIISLFKELLDDSKPRFKGITYYEDGNKDYYTCCVLSFENSGDIDSYIELTLNNEAIFMLRYEIQIDNSMNIVMDIGK